MPRKSVREKSVSRVETNGVSFLKEDKDTKRWDGLDTQKLCEECFESIKMIFKGGYMATKILAYIENKGRWREFSEYEDKSFAYFVEDYFGIRPGTYFNMKAIAYKYGAKAFDRWGWQTLKRVEGTSDPKATLKEMNKVYETTGKPSGKKVKEILDSNRPKLHVDGVFTPWSVQKAELLKENQALRDENTRLRDKIVSLEIKVEQLEEQMRR